MTCFQLTISTSYVPNWGAYEGVRELIQNALDAAQDGFPMTVAYDDDTRTLRITSAGARLERRVWLMGITSKADGDYRGHFGEGLKLGALALVRAGRPLRIVNDDEAWHVTLEPSEAFDGQPVLTVNVEKLAQSSSGFCVETSLLDGEWELFRPRFLALSPPKTRLETAGADIILDPERVGSLYVKGIFVEQKDRYRAAYNLRSADTDRDRNVVKTYDAEFSIRKAWEAAVLDQSISAVDFLDFLESDTGDAAAMRYCSNSDVHDIAASAFRAKYGDSAVPVRDEAQRKAVGHHGRLAVTSPRHLVEFFQGYPAMDAGLLASTIDTQVVRTYDVDDLTDKERLVYQQGVALADLAADREHLESVVGRLSIVDFYDSSVLGLHQGSESPAQILVARKELRHWRGFLETLVHELAHDLGDDGSVSHERAEGRLFSVIVDDLRRQVELLRRPVAA